MSSSFQPTLSPEDMIAFLSVNPLFGCLTRPALDLHLAMRDWTAYSIVYFDIDKMKACNERWGKEITSEKVKESLSVRSSDVIIGNWFSGDELVALVPGQDAVKFAQRIQRELARRGMSATFVIAHAGTEITARINQAERVVSALKDRGRRAMIAVV